MKGSVLERVKCIGCMNAFLPFLQRPLDIFVQEVSVFFASSGEDNIIISHCEIPKHCSDVLRVNCISLASFYDNIKCYILLYR